jgi:iron(III) transport system permease protein
MELRKHQCLAGSILIFSISFRELVGSVLLRAPGIETVATFILREFDQGRPTTGTAMGVMRSLSRSCRFRWRVV